MSEVSDITSEVSDITDIGDGVDRQWINVSQVKSIEDMLTILSLTRLYYCLMAICSMIFFSSGVEMSIGVFASAGWVNEMNYDQLFLFSGVLLIGQFFGTYVFGLLADYFGRRKTIIASSFVIACSSVLAAFTESHWPLLALRAVTGFGFGGLTVAFDLVAEYVPGSYRGRFLVLLKGFWALGILTTPVVFVMCKPFLGYRVVVLICAAPACISTVLSACFLPESARWLLVMGKPHLAEDALRYCGSRDVSLYKLQPHSAPQTSAFSFLNADNKGLIMPLCVLWTCFGFVSSGVVVHLCTGLMHNESSSNSTLNPSAYELLLRGSIAELVGIVVAILMVDSCGRVSSQVSLFAGSGVAAFCLGLGIPSLTESILVVILLATLSGGTAVSWTATAELFPTSCRATGHAFVHSFSILGSLLGLMLYAATTTRSLFICSVLSLAGCLAAVFALFPPETYGNTLDAVGSQKVNVKPKVITPRKPRGNVVFDANARYEQFFADPFDGNDDV